MDKDEALKLALEALERYQIKRQDFDTFAEAIAAIKEALAQPEREPVEDVVECFADGTRTVRIAVQRPWVDLTDEDCDEVERWVEFKEEGSDRIPIGKLARYIEAKSKELNT
jgi:hypothetical protein